MKIQQTKNIKDPELKDKAIFAMFKQLNLSEKKDFLQEIKDPEIRAQAVIDIFLALPKEEGKAFGRKEILDFLKIAKKLLFQNKKEGT